MTSKRRFKHTLEHKTPDRIPVDYLAVPAIDEALKKLYGVDTEQELLDILGCDFYYLSCRDISQNESCYPLYKGPPLETTDSERICPLGIRWKRGVYNSKFAVDNAIKGPLENAISEQDILRYNWPEPEWFELPPGHRQSFR